MSCSPKKMDITTLHSLLGDDECDYEKIKDRLERDSSDINERNLINLTPLMVLIKNKKCSAELIKLLVKHGAYINLQEPDYEDHPLNMALRHSKDLEIIRVLVDISPMHQEGRIQSPLCVALQNFSLEVVNFLLEAGFASDDYKCVLHPSLLHCALHTTKSRFITKDVFSALLQKQYQVNCLDSNGRTPFCIALMNGVEPYHLDLLKQAGASEFACKMHYFSPLLCATEYDVYFWHSNGKGGKLRAHAIHHLLKVGSQMNETDDENLTALQRALKYCDYEPAAVEMLLDLPEFDPNVLNSFGESLLYLALLNYHCKPEVVKLLIQRGVPLDARTTTGENALWPALKGDSDDYQDRPPQLIKLLIRDKCWSARSLANIRLLLKHGCPVNVKETKDGYTPLHVAMYNQVSYKILKVLFVAGARVEMENMRWYEMQIDDDDDFFLLYKFSIIEKPVFEGGYAPDGELYEDHEIALINEWESEAQEMHHAQVGPDLTLLEFMRRPVLPQLEASDYKPDECCFDFDKLLRMQPDRKFPRYFELIASKIGTWAMKAKLEDLLKGQIVRVCAGSPGKEKVCLNYEAVCKIVEFLSEEEILKLMVAFYDPVASCKNNSS